MASPASHTQANAQHLAWTSAITALLALVLIVTSCPAGDIADYRPVVHLILARLQTLTALSLTLQLVLTAAHVYRLPKRKRSSPVLRHMCGVGLAVPAFYALLVLVGAPATSLHEETLTYTTLLYSGKIFHTDSAGAVRLTHQLQCEAAVLIAVLLGGYAGCFSLALDWERQWQYWPVPNALGSCVGCVLANAITELSGLRHGSNEIKPSIL